MDLNAVVSGTSPAYTLRREHPTGKEYANYLRAVSNYLKLPIVEETTVEEVNISKKFYSQTKLIITKIIFLYMFLCEN